MHIYNVTVNVDDSIREEWVRWMQETHIPDMLRTGKFYSAKLCRVLVDEEMGGTTYAVQYSCADKNTLERYYEENAETLRGDAVKKFGDKMVAFRTELEVVDEKIALPEAATTHLFVYGTLMDERVQEMVLSRIPEQQPDTLKKFVKRNMQVAGRYPDLIYTDNPEDLVQGKYLVLNKHELPLLDHYEGSAYKRVQVVLESGQTAWVYVNSETENSPS